VFLTPHIAGSHGNELGRLGQTVVAELERLVAGVPLAHHILPGTLIARRDRGQRRAIVIRTIPSSRRTARAATIID
jgi:hypothetical protein